MAEEGVRSISLDGVEVLSFRRAGSDFVACSALGHLYGLSDSFKTRETYPVYDLEWYPSYLVHDRSTGVRKRIRVITRLAKRARAFVNACDYDAEGGTIGENILRYACGRAEGSAVRAKFSTLTKQEIVPAFEQASTGTGAGLALAGRARHVLDFLWGINLSRVLSASFNSSWSGYKTISMGRVQGPTLDFVVQREVEIRNFVPTPYWTVAATFEKDGTTFQVPSLYGKFLVQSLAQTVKSDCEGESGRVSLAEKAAYRERPPSPFDTTDLQREAFRVFGYLPSRTLQIAQRLYLDATISYPRTGSQKLPPSIGYGEIISKLSSIEEYSGLTAQLRGRGLSPKEGYKTDPAHPAIYPTGERLRRSLSSQEGRLLDLIVRRFLACFAEDAVRERTDLRIDVGEHQFGATGRRTLRSGWMKVYGRYSSTEDQVVPKVEVGDMLPVVAVSCEEKMESSPQRYNQSSLLGRMEQEEIGTKATRAEIISTLVTRGYIAGEKIVATDLGIALVEKLQEHCPQIISTKLTRETEKELEGIEAGTTDYEETIERAIDLLSGQIETLRKNFGALGEEINRAAVKESVDQKTLGQCPVCKEGKLMVIRSRKTGKRFAGCSNYSKGCRTSAPLPQKGSIKPAVKPCSKCGWPVIYVRTWRYPWRLCINMECENKGKRTRHVVQTLPKRS